MALDWGTASAAGAGLSTLGDLWLRKLSDDEAQRRFEEQQKRLEKKDQEAAQDRDDDRAFRKWQREQADRAASDTRINKAMTDLTNFYAKKGVVLNPEKARQYSTASDMSELPADVGMAGVASSASNAVRGAGRNLGTRFNDAAMQALMASGQQGGAMVDMGDQLGFARDEDALRAAEARSLARQRAEDEDKMRRAIAAITAGGRAGERQDKKQEKLDAAEAWWNDVVKNGANMDPNSDVEANRARVVGAFNRMRKAHPRWSPQDIMLAVQGGISTGGKMENTEARTAKTAGDTRGARGGRTINPPGAPTGGNAPAAGKPMSRAAYDAAVKAGYTDDEIRKSGYTIPQGD